MKQSYFLVCCLFLAILCFQTSEAQSQKDREKITGRYNKPKLKELQSKFEKKQANEKRKAWGLAKQKGWEIYRKREDGSVDELMAVSAEGTPIYYSVANVDAARSTRADRLHSGGDLGLNINGENMIAYVWDGGATRPTHQEFDGAGGSNRVSIIDGATSLNGNSFHAMHVTGTIVASGFQPAAKGMAWKARARTSDWSNDLSEATSAASNGMLVSNHSYGYAARDQYGQPQLPAYYFGGYIQESRDWDELMFNSPNYLMVVAAGNDGNDNGANSSPLGGQSAYDKLSGHSVSKNSMVVANANDANIDSNGNLVSVTINSSSSEGPTDDYRIKPDITGNGTQVYSTYDNSDSAYNSITGTSMASPNVAGTLLLLQQHANNVNGNFMKAATLKGLALHTADDAGTTGPDPVFGWGLMNAKKAAQVISQNGSESQINELTLMSGQSYEITVDSDGVSELVASISWTDRPGTATTTTNSTTARLVNDLDIRVSKGGTTFTPWRLTGVTTNGKGDNTKDPFERVNVANASGTYTITVTHKGSLVGGSQNYSLILSGLSGTPIACDATTPSNLSIDGFGDTTASVSWDAVEGASYDVRYRATGTSSWNVNAVTATSYSISGLSSETEYEVQVRSKCDGGDTSSYSASQTFTTSATQLSYCASKSSNVNDEYIGKVALGTIDNSSGAQFYSDFTNVSTSLSKGQAYTITVTPTWTGTVYSEGYAVWIDYNMDGDFSDSGEQVWSRSATQNASVSGTFTVPSGAVTGATRMRVSMKYNGIPTSCESFTYGEVEDYTINIQGSGADTTPPSAPANLTASNVTQTSVDLSWNAATDNVGVTGYDVYMNGTVLGTVTGTSTSVSSLSAGTTYNFYVVATDDAENESANSNTISVTTQSNTVSYCASKGNNSNYEWIDLVRLNGMENATGNNSGYRDFTNLTAPLPYGSNTINISAGFSGSSYTEYWKIWIDYNKNGTFESSELVVSGSSSSSATLQASFTVPTTAAAGTTRMRVSMKYNSAQTACETFSYGEVEDYTVNIGQSVNSYATFAENNGKQLGFEKNVFDVSLYPNPVISGNILNVDTADDRKLKYRVYNALGLKLLNGNLKGNSIDVSRLPSGTYIIHFDDKQKEIVKKFVKI